MLFRTNISFLVLAVVLILALAGCSPALVSVAPNLPAKQASGSDAQVSGAIAGAKAGAQPGLVAQTGQTAQASAPTGTGGISVSGSGQVAGSPDIARIVVGVQTQGSDVKQAVSDNNKGMSALLNTLKGAGISDKDIQTMNYNVSVENPQNPGVVTGQSTKPEVTYHVSNQVQVTVRDLTKLSDILDQAVSSGANTIYGVSFDVSDPTKLEDQARTQAIADAKARAEKLAQLEGVTLGSVISVSEGSGNPGPIFAAASMLGKGGGAPIEGGSIMVTVNVQVTYAIK